jgi:hypothetical protein
MIHFLPKCRVEGNRIRTTPRVMGAANGTMLSPLEDLGEERARYHYEHVRPFTTQRFSAMKLYYNLCRVHQKLRVTPATETRLSDQVWSIGELVSLLDKRSTLHRLLKTA